MARTTPTRIISAIPGRVIRAAGLNSGRSRFAFGSLSVVEPGTVSSLTAVVAELSVGVAEVVLVDDGIATGATVRAAIRALGERGVARTIVACPVAPPETVEVLRGEADDVVCLATPASFRAVGVWYRDFTPVRDSEVRSILAAAAQSARSP